MESVRSIDQWENGENSIKIRKIKFKLKDVAKKKAPKGAKKTAPKGAVISSIRTDQPRPTSDPRKIEPPDWELTVL